jgi:RNA polymerase sigma-70 factor (ECF subfamily)
MKMNGCTFEEIEKVTGLQQTNMRVIISRVRKRFREFYDKI